MDYSSLEQFLSSHEAEACDSDEVSLCLQQYKDGLLKLLDFKVGPVCLQFGAQPFGGGNFRRSPSNRWTTSYGVRYVIFCVVYRGHQLSHGGKCSSGGC